MIRKIVLRAPRDNLETSIIPVKYVYFELSGSIQYHKVLLRCVLQL